MSDKQQAGSQDVKQELLQSVIQSSGVGRYVCFSRSGVKRLIQTVTKASEKGLKRGESNKIRRLLNLFFLMQAKAQGSYAFGNVDSGEIDMRPGVGCITTADLLAVCGKDMQRVCDYVVACVKTKLFSICAYDYGTLDSEAEMIREAEDVIGYGHSLNYEINPAHWIVVQGNVGGWFSMFRSEAVELAMEYANRPVEFAVLLCVLANATQDNGGRVTVYQDAIAHTCGTHRITVGKAIASLSEPATGILEREPRRHAREQVVVKVLKAGLFAAASLREEFVTTIGKNPRHFESDNALLAMVEHWNGQRAKPGKLSLLREQKLEDKRLITRWRRAWKDSEARLAMSDPAKLLYELANADLGYLGFRFTNLQALLYPKKDEPTGPLLIQRVMNGDYRDFKKRW